MVREEMIISEVHGLLQSTKAVGNCAPKQVLEYPVPGQIIRED